MKAYSKCSLFALLSAILLFAASSVFAAPYEKAVTSYEMNPNVISYLDQLPQPVGGYEALINKVEYPELAVKANMEGDVLAKVTIGYDGNVEKVELLKSLGGGCDEAVINAIKDTKFKYSPASENSPIIRQISILFRFSKHNQ
ncbi:MAG: energy transducer TonB [Bacteroidota bacterium]|nr:energy transducer TonB [Bacteroidota bacterium]MDP4192057.1 energy transducer TonB [Bacteroidota bacterium]MDP4194477.1 energy transducer TonB [Bacteroidota bacterium]